MSKKEVAAPPTNDLLASLGIQTNSDTEVLKEMGQGDFLARIQLNTKAKPDMKEVNKFYLIQGNNKTVLGDEVELIPIDFWPMALDTAKGVSSYTHDDPEFIRIQSTSETVQDSGCMFGALFFCYVPALNDCATVLFGTKSMRNEIPNMNALMTKGVCLKPEYIDGKSYQWWTTKVSESVTPLTIPDPELVKKAHAKFAKLPEAALLRQKENEGGGEVDNSATSAER